MEAVDTWEHEGIAVELHQDTDAGNPFAEFDQACKLLVAPSVHWNIGETESMIDDRDSAVIARYLTLCEGYLLAVPFKIETRGGQARAYTIEPERGRTADGFVVLTREGVETCGVPEDRFAQCVEDEFGEFAKWVEGDVYGYIVAKGTPEEDSCWGHYGHEWAKEAANEAAGYAATETAERKRMERVYLLDPSA